MKNVISKTFLNIVYIGILGSFALSLSNAWAGDFGDVDQDEDQSGFYYEPSENPAEYGSVIPEDSQPQPASYYEDLQPGASPEPLNFNPDDYNNNDTYEDLGHGFIAGGLGSSSGDITGGGWGNTTPESFTSDEDFSSDFNSNDEEYFSEDLSEEE